MAWLHLSNGTTNLDVPVDKDGGAVSYAEIGDRATAFDGSLNVSVLTRKRTWSATTGLLDPSTTAATLRSLLTANPTLTMTGDWAGGSVTVWPQLTSEKPINTSPPTEQFIFTLTEA